MAGTLATAVREAKAPPPPARRGRRRSSTYAGVLFVLPAALSGIIAAFIVGALLLDWKKALLYIVLPQQVALFSVLAFNYLQHVHADEESEWNHSRNMLSPVMNALLFNNGYHTIHHEKPGIHWSKLPEAHADADDRAAADR